MPEVEHASSSTIHRRLDVLSSLYKLLGPDATDRVVRKYPGELGLDRGYSARSMRATFITTALENGAQLENVQTASSTKAIGAIELTIASRSAAGRSQNVWISFVFSALVCSSFRETRPVLPSSAAIPRVARCRIGGMTSNRHTPAAWRQV
jgi:hypothetical protein